ncbi:MAG: hypothetical protein AAF438_16650 [Pseudomonadota bacterium]
MLKMSIFVTLIALSLNAHAERCAYPKGIQNMPNGKKATREQILETKKKVDTYISDAQAYLECIQKREDEMQAKSELAPDDPINMERKALWSKRHNAMVEEMESTADRFNVELREFKKANP